MKKLINDFSFLKRLGIIFVISLLCYIVFKDTNEYIGSLLMIPMSGIGFLFVVSFLVFLIQFIGELCGKLVGVSERKIKQLDNSDFKFNKEYYREILKINSPLLLGYIDNLELDKNKIIAELLYLKMRNLISVEDGRIKKCSDYENIGLLKSEKLIMDSIYCNKFRISDYDAFLTRLRNQVICESESLSLIKKKDYKKQNGDTEGKKINWSGIIEKYLRHYCIWTYFFVCYRSFDISQIS